MSARWQVHVEGPDDLLPAASRLDAMRQAHAINAEALALMELVGDDAMYPTTWAKPVAVRRPCDGRNANVCVAEGCFGQACIGGLS